MKKIERPLGLKVLGGINLFIFGILILIVSNFLYHDLSSSAGQKILEDINQQFAGSGVDTIALLKRMVQLQMALSLVFIASGVGLLLIKEWARRLTLYFSFFIVILTFFGVLGNFALSSRAVLQLIYPAILIIYLTRKDIEERFNPTAKKNKEGKE